MFTKTTFSYKDLLNIIRHLPEPMLITSNDADNMYKIIEVNEALINHSGYSRTELLNMNGFDLVDKSFLTKVSYDHQKTLKDRYAQFESLHVTKQDKKIPVSIKINVVEIENNKLINLIQFYDISEKHETEKRLNKTDNQLESLFEYNPDLIFMLSEDGYFININPAAEKLLKYSKAQLQRMFYTEIIHKEDVNLANQYFSKVIQKEVAQLELRVQDINQQTIMLDLTAGPIIDQGQVKGIIGIARDITVKKKMERQLQDSEQRYRSLFDDNIDAVLTFDLEGHFVYVNQATENLMGYTSKELIGKQFLPFIVSDRQEYTINEFMKVKNGQAVQYETAMYNNKQEVVELHVTVIPIIIDGNITGIHCIGKDITEKKYFEEKLNEMAYHDYLTQLPNQHAFHKYINNLINTNKKFSMYFLDLDRFKSINDALGHEFGDMMLKTTAARLKKHLPKHAKVFRYGGDEFIITLKHSYEEEINEVAHTILNLFNKPFSLNDIELSTSTSIGISVYPSDGEDTDTLIRKSDNAMYFAKRNGKNQFQLYQSITNNNYDRYFKIEPLLKNAIENNELSLVYQPQINLKTNQVHGVEALLRWENRELGSIPPTEFIPIAEDSGLIVEIGQWVIESACKQLSEWQNSGFSALQISVNVSIRQFYHTDFINHLENTLKKTGINPNNLKLEITESIASNADIVLDILQRLKEIGVKVSIDDFGTGYSSLNYLKDFPIDELKIDKSFTWDITTDNKDQDIVSTIITLAHNLNLVTVAEGTETEEHIQFLNENQCDIAQGYYFSRPLDPDTCRDWILKWEDDLQ